ncbi:MAG: class D sortase [Armatimonadota bacterium]|nr:class D sortase [Armatimonadota bacterium]
MKHAGTGLMVAGALLVLYYPSTWVYGKVSQAYLHQQWHSAGTATDQAAAELFGRLVIPKILVDQIVLDGVEESQLARGPGHYKTSAMPGDGNCVIIGHLNTNGSPFRDLDRLAPGDMVLVRADASSSLVTYRVTGSRIVPPTDMALVKPEGKSRLTLITCMPGAKMRFAVFCKQETVQ